MKRYEILPHTADVAIRVTAETRAGLLTAAMQGMFAAAEPRFSEPEQTADRQFSISSNDFASLLVDVLNEAIYQAGTNHEAFDNIRFTLITDKKAEGAFIGRAVTGFETEIKAATFHDLKVEKKAQGEWETVITFDV